MTILLVIGMCVFFGLCAWAGALDKGNDTIP